MISVVQAFIALFAAQQTKSYLNYQAKVDKVVEPGREWRIKLKGVYWTARSYSGVNFQPGDWVKVVGRDGIALVIAPLESEEFI